MSLPESFPNWPQCPGCGAYTPNLEAHQCDPLMKALVDRHNAKAKASDKE